MFREYSENMINADNQQATSKEEVVRDYQRERRGPYDIVRSAWRHAGCAKARQPNRLNRTQASILSGLLLGDGHLEAVTRDQTYRLKVEHSLKQKEYVDWLYDKFADFIRNEPYTKTKYSFCLDRKSTRLNSSHQIISYAVFCLKKKKKKIMNV